MTIELTIISLDFEADTTPITRAFDSEEVLIGSAPGCDLVLTGSEINQQHLQIRAVHTGTSTLEQIFVRDLGGTVPTLLENQELPGGVDVEIASGARLIVGSYLIRINLVESHNKQGRMLQNTTPVLPAEPPPPPPHRPEPVAAPVYSPPSRRESAHAVAATPVGSPVSSSSPISVVIDTQPILNLDFDAIPLLTLEGRVTHRSAPLSRVMIDAGNHGSTLTDNHGHFVLAGIPEGAEFSLSAHHDDFHFDSPVAGILDEETYVEFFAIRLVTVGGTIMHRGIPVEGVTIDAGSFGKTFTDSEGRYEFSGIPENTKLTINAYKDNFIFVSSNRIA